MAFAAELSVHCGGAYQYEVELKNECLLRVGWAALEGRRALGTDERSFGYGGTGMKSNCGKFEQLGLQRCPALQEPHLDPQLYCLGLEGRAKQIMT